MNAICIIFQSVLVFLTILTVASNLLGINETETPSENVVMGSLLAQ